MNWHQVIDQRSHELHQVVADILRHQPGELASVVTWIETKLKDPRYSDDGKEALREWQDLIYQRGVTGVLSVLDDRTEEAVRLRQSTPFAILMPQDKREEIFRKYESLRVGTSVARV
jgi:hypothetical protein